MTTKDFPIEECAKQAADLIDMGASVYQKWSCSHCGSRQTMSERNKFFTRGNCEACGKQTNIQAKGCNYLVIMEAI